MSDPVERTPPPIPEPQETATDHEPSHLSSDPSENWRKPPLLARVNGRYADAYRLASSITGVGNFIKGVSFVLGFLIAVPAFAADNTALALGGFLAAIFAVVWIYILGLLLSAQGQILRAGLDAAVNSFPSLSEAKKLELLGL